MHTLLSICPLLLLLTATAASAQSFTIEVSPPVQTVQVGQSATYTITARAEGGFGASVFLRVIAPALNPTGITLDPPKINAPFSTGATLAITPSGGDIGTHTIVVEGRNGDMARYDTVMLTVTLNADADQWTHYHSGNSDLPPTRITGFAFDKTGNTWIATRQGILRAAPGEAPRLVAGPFQRDVGAVGVDSANGVWVAGSALSPGRHTLGRYFNGEWTIHEIPMADLNAGFRATSIAATPDGSVWFGGGGLLRIKDGVWRMFKPADWNNVLGGAIHDMVATPDGDLWTLNNRIERESSDGLLKFDGAFWTGYMVEELGMDMYATIEIADMAVGDSSRVWISGRSSITSPNGSTGIHRTTPFSVAEIAAGSNGRLWIVTHHTAGPRLAVEQGGTWREVSTEHSGLASTDQVYIEQFAVHEDGSVWIGTRDHGVAVLRPGSGTVGVPASEHRQASTSEILLLPNLSSVRLVTNGGAGRVSLHNSVGEQVALLFDGTIQPGEMTLPLDLSKMPNGAYIVTVAIEGKVPSSRMITIMR